MDNNIPGRTFSPQDNSTSGLNPSVPEVPVTPLPPVTPITPTGPIPQPLQTKPSKLKGILIPAIVALVAAVAAAGGVYYWQSQQVSKLKADNNNQKVTIAGLTTDVADLNKQVTDAKAKLVTPVDADVITSIVKRDCLAKVNYSFVSAKVTIKDTFATAAVACKLKTSKTATNTVDTLKKVSDGWALISVDTTKPSATTMKTYGIPATLYP